MTLVALILFAALGAGVAAWGLPRAGRAGRLGLGTGALALVLVIGLAFALEPAPVGDSGFPSGDLLRGHLVPTAYLRIVVGLWALESVVLVFIGWLLGGTATLRGLLPATLAAIGGGTAALAAANLGLSVAMATVTGLAALVVVLAVDGPAAVATAARELRVTLLGGALLLAAVEIIPVVAQVVILALGGGTQEGSAPGAPPIAGEAGAVIGLITLVGAVAIALRYGILPFHLRIPRLADVVPPISLPLLLVWIPLPLAVVAIAAVDGLVTPIDLALDGERTVIVLVALLTLVGAALAAFVQDDLRHATGYLVVADAGILVLAMAALDPAAWGPTRSWVLVMAASKTALGAWSAVMEERFGTRSIPDLRGWIRRSPLLAAGLVLTTLATFGLPGWVAYEARSTLTALAVDGPAATLFVVAGFLALPTYIRMLVLGGGAVTSRVDGAAPERIVPGRRGPRSRKGDLLPVELEGSRAAVPVPVPATVTASATGTNGATVPASATGTVPATVPASATGTVRATETGTNGATATATNGATATATPDRMAGIRRRAVSAATSASSAGASLKAAGTGAASSLHKTRSAAGNRLRTTGAMTSAPLTARLAASLQRDRTELLAGAVLALALLAALTSWGALDISRASAEPAPVVVATTAD